MNNQRTTPLDKLRAEKLKLKESCKLQEAKLLETMDFVGDNLIPALLGATVKVLTNPAKMVSTFKSETTGSSGISRGNSLFSGFIPNGIAGFAFKSVLGFAINRKFGKKSFTGRILGLALPLVAPAASKAIVKAGPYFVKIAKLGANAMEALINGRARRN